MEDLSPSYEILITKVEKLLKKYNQLKVEKNQLKQDNIELKGKLTESNSQIKDLQDRLALLKTAKSFSLQQDRTNVKHKINEYIREIDRCIALLNN